MTVKGYFGKLPSARDFVFQGLPTRLTVFWADHMAGWLTAGRRTGGDWKTRFLTSPVWRFVIPPGLAGPQGWVGLLAGSVDAVGREFPFTVMIEAAIDTATAQPVGDLDPHFDAIEDSLLEFLEGQVGEMALLQAIEKAALAVQASTAGPAPEQAQTLLVPTDDEDALCVTGWRHGAILAEGIAHSWASPNGSGSPAPLCLWWHEGIAGRDAEFCVTRGIPAPASTPPFFLGAWRHHGWSLRTVGSR